MNQHFLQVLPLAPQPATRMTSTCGPIPQHFPPTGFEPFLPPYAPPRGRWVWIQDEQPVWPTPRPGEWIAVTLDTTGAGTFAIQ